MDTNSQSQQSEQSAGVSQVPANQASNAGGNNAQPESVKPPQAAKPTGPVVSQEEKVWGVLAYLPMVSLATLVLKPTSKFCRLHGTQGLVLTGVEFLMLFVLGIIPTVGSILVLALLVLVVFGAFKALSGEYYQIPGISKIAEMVPVEALTAGVSAAESNEAKHGDANMAQTPATPPATPAGQMPKPEAQASNTEHVTQHNEVTSEVKKEEHMDQHQAPPAEDSSEHQQNSGGMEG